MIFSLLAKSSALSNGILRTGQHDSSKLANCAHSPDAFQMHRANLDHMAHFLALQDPIASTAGHACDVQQFRAVDHMVICKDTPVSDVHTNFSYQHTTAYLLCEPRRFLSLLLESTDCPRPPTM